MCVNARVCMCVYVRMCFYVSVYLCVCGGGGGGGRGGGYNQELLGKSSADEVAHAKIP